MNMACSCLQIKPFKPIHLYCGISLLLLFAGLAGCDKIDFPGGETRQKIERHLGKAKKLYEQRDYAGAIGEYDEILRIDPAYAEADMQIGLIYDRNLNDYLDAAFYYQRYLNSGHADPGKSELSRGFLENARLQFAATVPNSVSQGSPEVVKLRSENNALYRQVEDLKREVVALRKKLEENGSGSNKSNAVQSPEALIPPQISESSKHPGQPVQANPPPKIPPKTASSPKTYVVRKGDGIQSIAEKVYGDRSRWRDILAANPEIKDPNVLVPGQLLKLPK